MPFTDCREARFQRRLNRFVAELALPDGTTVQAHLANTGRMQELLRPDAPCLIRPAANPARKTAWDLLAVDADGRWVCLVASWANAFMADWLARGLIPGFEAITELRREVAIGHSRFDLAFTLDGQPWLAEVKSVNLVHQRQALFPDAPTSRGRRHVEELLALRREGWQVALFFVTMGQDVDSLGFNAAHDPAFAAVMARALADGVTARAFAARIAPPHVLYMGERPLR